MVLSPQNISAVALSEILDTRVSTVTIRPASDNWGATVTFLDVTYTSYTTDLPTSFALKNGKKDASRASAQREVDFYTNILPACPDKTMLPDVYHVQMGEGGDFHVLLKDYRATHVSNEDTFGIDNVRLEKAVVALARFHAQWWANESLSSALPDKEALLDHPHAREESYNLFSVAQEFLAANQILTSQERQRYELILSNYQIDQIVQRIHRDKCFTITHGDLWHGNVLFGGNSTIIIDWPNWSVGHPAFDLAYLICLGSTPENIESREDFLIDRYLMTLLNYSSVPKTTVSALKLDYYDIGKQIVALLPLWLWKDGQTVWTRIYKTLLANL